mgnify:CR=1 FL=1
MAGGVGQVRACTDALVGLAKDDGDDLTRTGDIVGTLRYMAPERFEGLRKGVQSDVYVGLEFVVSSDPPQGTMAPSGSTVTLFLV